MKNRISILATLLLTFCVNVVTAQLYEVSLDQKLQNSTLIIEGEVIESEAFRGHDGHIYTAHDIQAFSILKGSLQDLQDQKITVITYGGTLDEEVETWTHLLTLSKNDVGVFFLTATNRPIPDANKAFYEVYSSSQGFLRYTENSFQEVVAISPFNYHQKNDLLQNIRQSTGQFTPVYADGDGSPEDVTGVEYSIQNVSLSGNVLDFDIYVEGLWGSYDLTESELLIEYDPTVLGANVNSNGVLSISPGVVSSSPNYSLSVNDVNPDRVSINVKALNTGFTLYTISSVPEQLVHVQIVSPASGNPDIEFDEAAMQQLSEYLDANSGVEAFQQVFAVGKIEDIGGGAAIGPEIWDFYPDTIVSGINDTLTIIGDKFGATRGFSRIKFRNAKEGPNSPATWVGCIDSSYVYWSDDTIKVLVMSGGYSNNTTIVTNSDIPGTGPIRIEKGNSNLLADESADDLYIPYCLMNRTLNSLKYSVPIYLGDKNNDGGYNLVYINDFRRDTLARKAFERALTTWRCQTLVNFRIIDSTEANLSTDCIIRYGVLPDGTGGTTLTLGRTNPLETTCLNPANNPLYEVRERFVITFNDNLSWHKDTAFITLPNGTYDLESVALHELGHSMLLNHTNHTNDVMFWTNPTSQPRRTLLLNDLNGGLHACNISSSPFPTSCQSSMILISSMDCDSLTSSFPIGKDEYRELSIFPNPSKDFIQVQIKDSFNQMKYIKLSDSSGKIITHHKSKDEVITLDIRNIPVGIYFISVMMDNSYQTFKIVKYE